MRSVILALVIVAAPATAFAGGDCGYGHTAKQPQQTVMQDTNTTTQQTVIKEKKG